MTCHEARDQLSDLLDETLAGDARVRLLTHLAGCPECARERERLAQTVGLLRAVPAARAPSGFVDRVLAQTQRAPWYRRLSRGALLPWSVKLPVEAAAIVLVTVGVVYVYRSTPELQQAEHVAAPSVVFEAPAPSTPTSDAHEEAGRERTPDVGRSADFQARAAPERQRDLAPLGAKREFKREPAPPVSAPEPTRESPPSMAAPERTREASPATAAPDRSREVSPPVPSPEGKRQAPPPAAPAPAERRLDDKAEERSAAAPPARLGTETREQDRAAASEGRLAAPPASAPRLEKSASGAIAAARAPVTVGGQLTVVDREAAVQALADIAARLGAVSSSPRRGTDAVLVEIVVPAARYPELLAELRRVGRFVPDPPPATLPDPVRVLLRLTS